MCSPIPVWSCAAWTDREDPVECYLDAADRILVVASRKLLLRGLVVGDLIFSIDEHFEVLVLAQGPNAVKVVAAQRHVREVEHALGRDG